MIVYDGLKCDFLQSVENDTMYKENPDAALERADEIIKNTYRTLMTRGMKGCYIYCTDPGMREYIRKRLLAIPKGESFVHSM